MKRTQQKPAKKKKAAAPKKKSATAKKRPAAKKTAVPAKKKGAKKKAAKKAPRKWSARVTNTSDALDLKSQLFRSKNPRTIAVSLKKSAEKSKRKKGSPLQSAMSMLNFYINRAGKNLSAKEKQPLEKAKEILHDLFKGDK